MYGDCPWLNLLQNLCRGKESFGMVLMRRRVALAKNPALVESPGGRMAPNYQWLFDNRLTRSCTALKSAVTRLA
jgi:hypothetical protein